MKGLAEAQMVTWPYRVVAGEVLEIIMPTVLRVVTDEGPAPSTEIAPLICRVSEKGTIVLPIVGEMAVAGQSLEEIESTVAKAYYPEYIKTHPSVFAKILEYRTSRVSVTGAIYKPGIYELRADQMSLVTLLMTAGGIVNEGAAVVRIERSQRNATPSTPVEPDLPLARKASVTSVYPKRTESHAVSRAADPAPRLKQAGRPDLLPPRQSPLSGYVSMPRVGYAIRENPALTRSAGRFAALNQAAQIDPGLSFDDRRWALMDLLSTAPSQSDFRPSTVVQTQADAVKPSEIPRKRPPPPAEPAPAASSPDTIVLPVKGLNVPFKDVALHEGDIVVVEALVVPVFSVIGLVMKQGNFDYPPGQEFNLMQAIAFAGGLDDRSDPYYAVIYRLRPDGTIAHIPFDIRKPKHNSRAASAMNMTIHPGDIVAVEKTARTRTHAFLQGIFNFSVGAYARMPVFD